MKAPPRLLDDPELGPALADEVADARAYDPSALEARTLDALRSPSAAPGGVGAGGVATGTALALAVAALIALDVSPGENSTRDPAAPSSAAERRSASTERGPARGAGGAAPAPGAPRAGSSPRETHAADERAGAPDHASGRAGVPGEAYAPDDAGGRAGAPGEAYAPGDADGRAGAPDHADGAAGAPDDAEGRAASEAGAQPRASAPATAAERARARTRRPAEARDGTGPGRASTAGEARPAPRAEARPRPAPAPGSSNPAPTGSLGAETARAATSPSEVEAAPTSPALGGEARSTAPSNLAQDLADYDRGRAALDAGALEDAARALRAYLERHPRGRLRLEARLDLLEALVQLERPREALPLAEALLEDPAAAHRRPELSRLVVELRVAVGDCSGARALAREGPPALLRSAQKCEDGGG
jgi:hypothetical protein